MIDWAVAALVVCVAAVVQGTCGFAFGILSMAFLTLLYDTEHANVLSSLLACWSIGHTLWTVRRHIAWRVVRLLVSGGVVGTLIGTSLLVAEGTEALLRGLVAVACVLVAVQELRGLEPPPEAARQPTWLGVASGVVAGIFGGAVSTSGPPVIWFVYRHPLSREGLKATVLACFAVSMVVKFGYWIAYDIQAHLHGGDALFRPERLLQVATLLPFVILGTTVGVRLFGRVDKAGLRRMVAVLLLLLAAVMATSAVRTLG